MWTLAFGHLEDTPTHGYAVPREAAMAASAKSWPPASVFTLFVISSRLGWSVGAPMSLDWGVDVARLSLFLSEPYPISDKDWTIVTGQEEADTRQAVPGGKRLSGAVPTGVMHMNATASRFDVILTAAEIGEGEEMQLPSVGPLDETFKSFLESTCRWIEKVKPSVTRIAFGSVLTCRTADREETYRLLGTLLKSLKVDPKNMRDLQFRVNWPRTSKVEQGLVVNRLTTWSSLRIVRKFLQISEKDVTDAGGEHIDAVRLELDHNTDESKKTPFDQQNVIPIYSELVELARQNAAEGEVPCP
jgi:hypothetical protein